MPSSLVESRLMPQLKCPNCSREFVRRVARVGLKERVAGWFYVYPFRCQICGFRFRFLQWGVRYLHVDEDRREYDRMAMNFPVLFRGDQFDGDGNVLDISMGGCSFTTASKLAVGAIMRLELKISKDTVPLGLATKSTAPSSIASNVASAPSAVSDEIITTGLGASTMI